MASLLVRLKLATISTMTRLPAIAVAIMLAVALAMGTAKVAMAQNSEVHENNGEYQQARLALVEEVRAELKDLLTEAGYSFSVGPVLAALEKVPRHAFVPGAQVRHAYRNRPLAIGYGQTISQPLIVALMSTLADVSPSDRVLEVGTGSGYQAAVLGELAGEVYSIEIVEPLGKNAAETLQKLGYKNIHTRIGDGYGGWPSQAPFDAIVVTAAPAYIPTPLVEQLKPGGRLVIPVGEFEQELVVVEKLEDGTTRKREVVAVRFVPLVRDDP